MQVFSEPTPSEKLLRQYKWLAAILISTVIVGWHFYWQFHAGGLWRDEVNLVNVARRDSLAKIVSPSPINESHLAEDVHLFMFDGWREDTNNAK